MYLTYEEYKSLDGKVDVSAFPKYERQARKALDAYTQERLQRMETVPAVVKECMTSMIDDLADYDNDGNVKAFSNGVINLTFEDKKMDLYRNHIQFLPIELMSGVVE